MEPQIRMACFSDPMKFPLEKPGSFSCWRLTTHEWVPLSKSWLPGNLPPAHWEKKKNKTQQSSPMGLFFRGDTPSFSCSEKIPSTQTLCIFNGFTPWQQRHCPCSRYHISHRLGKGASCHYLQGLGSAPMRISNFIHFIRRLLFFIQRSLTWFCVQWSVAESPIIIGWIFTIPGTRKGWPRKVNPFKRVLLFESSLGDLWARCGESLRETLMCISAISWL